MPKDRVTGQHQGYGFVEFLSEEDADYAIKIMNRIKLYGKPIRENKASAHNKTWIAFGVILQTPKIMWDPDTGNSKSYAFIYFVSFDASDAAVEAMNGQYLYNRPITISYAFKDSKDEHHGSAAERLLASQNPLSQADRHHQLFADAPPPPSAPNPVVSSLGSGLPPRGMPPPGSFPPRVPPPGALPPGIPPAIPPPMPLGLQDMAPHWQEVQGQDILVMDTHILIHSHQDIPMLDTQGLGGSHHPNHHLECLILDLLQMGMHLKGLHSELPWVTQVLCLHMV
ncbi:Splicing factor 3B subunit 4 [Saguinus oedipus]|uniref:Splicing factor 3B subunit 4 n=1 Tax=Saguinus oedipus TaxID=9490 RepID=A0ABQ9W4R7_SAGOE|nr:Splicing factor 3B subunit 4 [Saguinus oedipus]